MKKTFISGIKPTGQLHIGNYFGAMRQFVNLQDEYDGSVFVPDLHAITTVKDSQSLIDGVLNVTMDYLAIGIDPKKVVIFKQSDLPEVTEMSWVFNCLVTMPYLMRAHAFKDSEAKNKEINVGVFDYPVLMAADILIQNVDIVPIGRDQKQHVEIARDIAEKFNSIYGEIFKIPEALIIEKFETVPGIDGQKMSKSYNNTIPIFATKDEVRKIVMSIPTDSKSPNEPKDTDSILFRIHKIFLSDSEQKELADIYKSGISYKDAKENLINEINKFCEPLIENRIKWQSNPDLVMDILNDGAKKAKKNTEKTIKLFREKVGILGLEK
ncbi:MAG TPA: tryptophan--tRNA ligase [Candidatus Paceibacterota bacterium]|nr:tryptophan--tRNA ligase [Candidatus Paceibacterota bacterium]